MLTTGFFSLMYCLGWSQSCKYDLHRIIVLSIFFLCCSVVANVFTNNMVISGVIKFVNATMVKVLFACPYIIWYIYNINIFFKKDNDCRKSAYYLWLAHLYIVIIAFLVLILFAFLFCLVMVLVCFVGCMLYG